MIRTDRLLLRAPREDDLDALHRVFSDPSAMRYWSHPAHETPARTALTVRYMRAAHKELGTEFVIERAGEVLGKAGMWRMGEIGYILHPDHWGLGYAHEALAAVLPHAFARHPELGEITAEVDPRNAGSVRLLEKLGFRESHRVERSIEVNGEWCDSIFYRLDRPLPSLS